MGYVFLFIAINAAAPSSSHSAEIQSNELVKLETRPGVTQKFILIKPENPVASVILFAGDSGNLQLVNASGKPTVSAMSKNFLVRTRKDFAEQGLTVAVIDSPPDKKKMNAIWRMSEEHGRDIKGVTNYLKRQANIPVWLVGTSMGTFSAPNGTIRNKEIVDGLVLTSSITRSRTKWKIYGTHPNGIVNMDLGKITVPTLIVSHQDDKCEITPASDAPKLKGALENSAKVEVIYFTGGRRPKSKPCQALSAHGFYGIEDEVVPAIADFIKANSK
jgi:hypothetical protein